MSQRGDQSLRRWTHSSCFKTNKLLCFLTRRPRMVRCSNLPPAGTSGSFKAVPGRAGDIWLAAARPAACTACGTPPTAGKVSTSCRRWMRPTTSVSACQPFIRSMWQFTAARRSMVSGASIVPWMRGTVGCASMTMPISMGRRMRQSLVTRESSVASMSQRTAEGSSTAISTIAEASRVPLAGGGAAYPWCCASLFRTSFAAHRIPPSPRFGNVTKADGGF
jgi:hypothetical protein